MPHPFHWVPAEGARHATCDVRPCGCRFPVGTRVTTLCGAQVVADDGDLAWLWGTCPACNAVARRLAGVDRG